jgi:hypothetical protein
MTYDSYPVPAYAAWVGRPRREHLIPFLPCGIRSERSVFMECASCGKVLPCGGRPPATCGGCYSPRAGTVVRRLSCLVLVPDQALELWPLMSMVYGRDLVLEQEWPVRGSTGPRTKRQCRALARAEFHSIIMRHPRSEMIRILNDPDASELPLLLKLSAITWTIRPEDSNVHYCSLLSRAVLLEKERPAAAGDTKEKLVCLLKRAVTELSWPELPAETAVMFNTCFRALTEIATFGEPEAAVEILSRHMEHVERRIIGPNHMARYYTYRLDLLLWAAVKFEEDDLKSGL